MEFPEKRYRANPGWKKRKIIRIPREEIEKATAEFLKEGGKITYLEPSGKHGTPINKVEPKRRVFGGNDIEDGWPSLLSF